MKKLISIILSVLMILSSFSVMSLVSAKETNVASTGAANSGTTGDCTWSFDESAGTLTISGNGAIPHYDSSTYKNIPWYVYKDSIKTVNIESGVTSIGTYVFYNYSNLTSITIPDSATSIGKCAFEGCTSLTSISISDSLTSVGWCAFYDCSKLKDVYYSGNKRQWQNLEKKVNRETQYKSDIIRFFRNNRAYNSAILNNDKLINEMTDYYVKLRIENEYCNPISAKDWIECLNDTISQFISNGKLNKYVA